MFFNGEHAQEDGHEGKIVLKILIDNKNKEIIVNNIKGAYNMYALQFTINGIYSFEVSSLKPFKGTEEESSK